MVDELIVRMADGSTRKVELSGDRYTVGRAIANDLPCPEDGELSRQHMAFERAGTHWLVVDLGSRNGTRLNGNRIGRSGPLKRGDLVSAGKLTIECSCAAAHPAQGASFDDRVVFTEASRREGVTSTVATSLDKLLSGEATFDEPNAVPQAGVSRMRALIDAGRELAYHRPLIELFPVILDLAAKAVGCSRGVLMLQEGESLVARAAKGNRFEISKAIRERVLQQKESLLIADALLDERLRLQASIVAQDVRGVIAVPLQTNEKVIGLIYLDSPALARPFTPEDLSLVTVMANIAAIRIENARLTEVEQHERLLARDMAQAAEIQKSLLPRSIPQQPGLELAAFSEPCLSVGGDHYDIYERDGKVVLLVADVAGKGMPAALMAAGLHARLQVLIEEETNLASLVSRLNRIVSSNCPGNRFITFFICEMDLAGGELAYVNAGHNPPILARSNGEVIHLEGGGTVLGIFGKADYFLQTVHMDEGDLLAMFSDGVTEAENLAVEQQFGEERLLEAMAPFDAWSPEQMVERIKNAVRHFAGSVSAADDFTLILARRTRGVNR